MLVAHHPVAHPADAAPNRLHVAQPDALAVGQREIVAVMQAARRCGRVPQGDDRSRIGAEPAQGNAPQRKQVHHPRVLHSKAVLASGDGDETLLDGCRPPAAALAAGQLQRIAIVEPFEAQLVKERFVQRQHLLVLEVAERVLIADVEQRTTQRETLRVHQGRRDRRAASVCTENEHAHARRGHGRQSIRMGRHQRLAVPDVCVVGSGFAGLAVAERLAQQGASVLVLEAGRTTSAALAPRLTVAGDADFDVDDSRVLAPGGTSARWNGVATRPEPETVAEWPIRWTDLEPYLDQAEACLQVAGEPVVPGAEPPRHLPLHPPTTTLRPEHLPSLSYLSPVVLPFAFVDGGPRRLAAHDLPRVMAQANVVVREGAWVRAVEPAGRAGGVRLHVDDPAAPGSSHSQVVRAGAVVLACGVVETVRVLQSSRTRWRGRIGGPLLGAGINAHPRRRCTIGRHPELEGLHGVLRSYRVGDTFTAAGLGRVVLDVNYMDHTPMIDVTVEQQPSALNRITARGSALTATLHLSTRDHATLTAADDLIAEVSARLPGAGRPSEPITRWFHPAGGCAVGADEASGVVDHFGQVFGAPGVYVAGAATFPTSGAGNPTVTITALALRLADHLAARG